MSAAANESISSKCQMAVCMPKHKMRDTGVVTREDFDGGPISLDEIDGGLYLGNLTAATHMETLRSFNISYILTLDSVPLAKHITEASFLTTKYIQIADMPKEDILHHLNDCVAFISEALAKGNKILVHCYFGVSRSSSAVIAYVMKHYGMDYQGAYEFVKAKRRFVQPNAGFVAQLKLWRRMGYAIDPQYQKYKLYRLRLAGEQVRKAKILPQNFNNLIKPDPAITQENPEPIVYRCRKCRRILASKSHLLLHASKSQITEKQPTNGNSTTSITTTQQQATATETATETETATTTTEQHTQTTGARLLEQISQQIRKVSLGTPTGGAADQQDPLNDVTLCQSILFVEPIAWMQNIANNTQGRLSCPKCEQKLGNYSWINGCQCPCGEEVSPAFYLIPSKVELSKAVQNVQTTL